MKGGSLLGGNAGSVLSENQHYYLIRDAAFVVARWHKQDGPYSVEDLCQQYTKVLIGGVLAPAKS